MEMIDFRSDTVTKPTQEMREAMLTAPVGDDVYGEDPTVNRLEELAAKITGKEAALFVPSGTMGNQLSIMAYTRPGEEMIAGMRSHIVHYEAGGAARLSGVSSALVDNPDNKIKPEDVRHLVRPTGNPHFPRSSLLCVENALSNGDVVTLEELSDLQNVAREYGLKIHMDGARLFNAAYALGTTVDKIVSYVDSVMFCVSKGLCAPIGSLVCGTEAFIEEARRCRKLMGGGMRQVGILAACGIIALEKMAGRLEEDHDNAKYLAVELSKIPGIHVDVDRVQINMVFWESHLPGFWSEDFVEFMQARGFLVGGVYAGAYRLVTHHGITRFHVEKALSCIREFVSQITN